MVAKVSVTKTGDGLLKIKEAIDRLNKTDVLVGVPSSTTVRPDNAPINNASLLYLHTYGSDLQKIPARPVIEPALNAPGNKEALHRTMAEVSRSVLRGDYAVTTIKLKKLGMMAQNIVRRWFVDPRNGWPPNSPTTIARKLRNMSSKDIRKAITRGEPLTRPLIDTGELRKSITYVVREGK